MSAARPYAKAAVAFAEEKKSLSEWLHSLRLLALVAADRRVKKLVLNPQLSLEQTVDIFKSIVQPLAPGVENFLRLLSERKRLSLLPAIAELFAEYYARQAKILVVDVSTASNLSATQSAQLNQVLSQHFAKTIDMRQHVDAKLLGGALIRADDLVIDVSVRGQLEKLAKELV